jgi:hypothetical protein
MRVVGNHAAFACLCAVTCIPLPHLPPHPLGRGGRYSTSLAAFCGGGLLVAGYLAFSFANSAPAMAFAWVCVGIGSGSTFQVRGRAQCTLRIWPLWPQVLWSWKG